MEPAAARPAPARDAPPVTDLRVARIALPVVLSNAAVPLQGAIDTAIVGNLGEASALAAVTLGATVVALLFNSFNFLQMGVSGLSAQALGRGEAAEVVDVLARALILALAIAAALNLASAPLSRLGAWLSEGSQEAEALSQAYVAIRLWGAPAELAGYALIGWFAGQELTRRLFEMQVTASLVNVGLNLWFVLGLGWGVEGVALGTALAAYAGLAVGLWRARSRSRALAPGWRARAGRLMARAALGRLMALNRDIFVRTLCLGASFAWMAHLGSRMGDATLAANGILMQFLTVSAYALDGFAMAAETLVGQALGRRDGPGLRRAAVVSTRAALGLAGLFALLASLGAGPLVALFTNVEAVRAIALEHVLWATCLPLVAVLAYQMDGIFIGAAAGRAMRDCMVISFLGFLGLGWALAGALGNHGLWLALWAWMLLRAATLLWRYPGLERRTGQAALGD